MRPNASAGTFRPAHHRDYLRDNSRDAAMVTDKSAAPILAKDAVPDRKDIEDHKDRLYATRSRSRSEYGSISTTIFLTTTLGALRRPTVFIVMKPAAWNFASVRVKFG